MRNRINQRQAPAAIRAHKDFQASGLSGFNDGPHRYVVLSYQTVIAAFDEGEGWSMDPTRYSVTTSRHQSLVRRSIAPSVARSASLNSLVRQPKPDARALGAAILDGAAPVYATVADVPDAYRLLTGNAAKEFGNCGCAFVLEHCGRCLHVLVTGADTTTPRPDAPVRETYRAGRTLNPAGRFTSHPLPTGE